MFIHLPGGCKEAIHSFQVIQSLFFLLSGARSAICLSSSPFLNSSCSEFHCRYSSEIRLPLLVNLPYCLKDSEPIFFCKFFAIDLICADEAELICFAPLLDNKIEKSYTPFCIEITNGCLVKFFIVHLGQGML